MILGNIVLFSLFTAILLRNFEGDEEEEDSEDEDEQVESKSFSQHFSRKGCSDMFESFKLTFGKKRRRSLAASNEDATLIQTSKVA